MGATGPDHDQLQLADPLILAPRSRYAAWLEPLSSLADLVNTFEELPMDPLVIAASKALRMLIRKLRQVLSPGGSLFLAVAETALNPGHIFTCVSYNKAIHYQM